VNLVTLRWLRIKDAVRHWLGITILTSEQKKLLDEMDSDYEKMLAQKKAKKTPTPDP